MKRIVLLVALCACDKTPPKVTVAEPCAPAAEHATAIVSAEEMARPKKEVDERSARASRFQIQLEARCHEDRWPKDVPTCLAKIEKRDEVAPCWATLPADQRATLDGILDDFYHRPAGL